MRSFTVVVILVLCSMACVKAQTDPCTVLSEKYGTCIANAGGVKGGLDAQYCKTDCFSYLPQFDSANCLDASAEICASIKSCIQECTPGSEECLEDEIAAYSCLFSGQLTENCTITCDGSGSGGSGSGRSGGGSGNIDADDPKSSTSAASTMTAFPVSVAALLIGAGLAI